MTPFYDEPDRDAAIDTLRRAREIGVDFLDSSDAYGQGRNEELIASAVKGHRSEYVIASKFGNLRAADGSPTSDGRREYVKACCERSLKRLETDVIVDPTIPIEATVGAMSDLVREGKVRHLGICEAGVMTIRRAHATHPLCAVQIEYSLWTRDVETKILPLCEELGIGFVAYSPLGRGFLTGKIADTSALRVGDARRKMPRFQGDNLHRNLALIDRPESAEKTRVAMAALSGEKTPAEPPNTGSYTADGCRLQMRLAAYRTGSGVAPIGYQLLDQLGTRGLVLDQQHAGGEPVALLAHRALERRVFEPLE
jgi:aryl-alcohol dehydrogenase-like predicted oxidoreductase